MATEYAPFYLDRTGEYTNTLLVNTGSTIEDAWLDFENTRQWQPVDGAAQLFTPNWSNEVQAQKREVFVKSGAVACAAFRESSAPRDAQDRVLNWVGHQLQPVGLLGDSSADTFEAILLRAGEGLDAHQEFLRAAITVSQHYTEIYRDLEFSRVAYAGAGYMLNLLDLGWEATQEPLIEQEIEEAFESLDWNELLK